MAVRRARLLAAGSAAAALSYAAGIREVRRQVRAHQREWHLRNRAALTRLQENEQALSLVVLGDSAAQGVGARSVDASYPALLARDLQAQLGEQVMVVNLSASGATLETMLARQVPRLHRLGFRPDFLVANIGGNDVGVRGLTAQTFRQQAEHFYRSVPTDPTLGNIPSFSLLPQERRAEEFSAILDEEASKAGQTVTDLRGLTKGYSTAEYILRYHAPDLFHPNGRAYAQWAREFSRDILQVNGKKRAAE